MRIEVVGPAVIHRRERQEGMLVLPVAFHLESGRGCWLRAVRLEAATLDRGVEISGLSPVEVHPHGEPAGPIGVPLHLRPPPGEEEGANRLDLHLPITLPDGLRPLEGGCLRLAFELDRAVSVTYQAPFHWWTREGRVEFDALRRTGSALPLHLKLAALWTLLVALVVWNQAFNQGVHESGDAMTWLLSSRNVDRALFFLTGLFGLHLVGAAWSSIRSWVSFWRLPELYLNRDFTLFLRSRLATLSLLGAGLLCAAVFVSFHSVPLSREGMPSRASWWLKGQEVAAKRVLSREVGAMVLRCGRSGQHPLAGARVDLKTGAVIPDYRPYYAEVDTLDVPEGCANGHDGRKSVRVRFTAADDFDDRCIQPFRREIRALFCGYSVEKRFVVTWAGDNALKVEPHEELGLGGLVRLIEDHWLPHLPVPVVASVSASTTAEVSPPTGDVPAEVSLPMPQELVASSRSVTAGQRLRWRAFEEQYKKSIGSFRQSSPGQALREMIVLHAAFELYRTAPADGGGLPVAFVDELQNDFNELYGEKARVAEADKPKLAAYLRFLLSIERELGDRPEATRLASTIKAALDKEGYEFYMLYLRASVATAKAYGGSFRTDASQERYDFLLERLTAVSPLARNLRAELHAIADDLRDRKELYREELDLVEILLARAPELVG